MKYVCLFPGQGSQHPGMDIVHPRIDPHIQAALAEASDALGFDLGKLVSEGPEEELNQTHNTQPALLAVSIGLWRALPENVEISAVAGHSLGEYSALVAAGVLDFSDAIRLVRRRGELMQEAVAGMETAMAAILGLDDDAVRRVCATVAGDEVVEAVNFNCPGQVVIAGQRAAVERAIPALKEAGARRTMPLPVSVPSHCALMKPAAEELSAAIEAVEFKTPQYPVYQNVTGESVSDPERIRAQLLSQLYSPVLWSKTVQALVDAGETVFLECGPGKVVSGLVKKIQRSAEIIALSQAESWESLV